MSTCIKDLYEYGWIKKCLKCGNISLKSTFYKNKKGKNYLQPICNFCVNEYFVDNKDPLLNKQKFYNRRKRDKINTRMNEYKKNRIKTNVNFRLIRNTGRRNHHALNGKLKSSSTKENSGIDTDTYWKWIEYHMTPDMTWNVIEIDHVTTICFFDVSKDEEVNEAISWKNTQPSLKHDHQ